MNSFAFSRKVIALLVTLMVQIFVMGYAHAQRVALLIGNASYQTGQLRNPPNDVREMEAALNAVGFKVQKVLNANQSAMKRAVRDFGSLAQGAEVALLYYSGHGTQALGENYLIPISATIEKEGDYEVEAVSVNALLRQIVSARPKAAIVVLDACRDNPFASLSKGGSKGLARMEAPTGTMIAFATAPNTTAADEGNYAKVLAKQIRTPGLELLDVFRKTSAEVMRLSGGKQEPRISEVSINESLYLAGAAPTSLVGTLVASVSPQPTGIPQQADPEQEAWEIAKKRDTSASYQAYRSRYPNGRYVDAANVALEISQQTFAGNSSEGRETTPVLDAIKKPRTFNLSISDVLDTQSFGVGRCQFVRKHSELIRSKLLQFLPTHFRDIKLLSERSAELEIDVTPVAVSLGGGSSIGKEYAMEATTLVAVRWKGASLFSKAFKGKSVHTYPRSFSCDGWNPDISQVLDSVLDEMIESFGSSLNAALEH